MTATDVGKLPQPAWATSSVRAIMTPLESLVVVTPDESVEAVIRKQHGVAQVPVISRGDLVGMVDRRQLAQWLSLWLAPRGA